MEALNLEKMRAELLSGNNQCLKILFEQFGTYCIRLLQKNTGCSKQDAEDILMDAVINFRQKIITGKIQYLTSAKNYLFTTCYNMALVRFNKEKVKNTRIADVVEALYAPSEPIGDREAMHDIFAAAMSALGEKCREIITLYYFEQLSMKDIAEQLGLGNAEVAKSTKSRCFKKLTEEASRLLKLQNLTNAI